VVLAVDAARMKADGHRIVRRGEGVYTTGRVPPGFVSRW
jgi:RNA:NAD 2'-phosphotransferase (TPT1/KptA family)